ncbi:CocE/NonD family hydrolase [Streptomyces syringium]|uniref:Acyl esterase n=1 Tax=Streptomyces syringium TaxID=76729 RepID=A0ABS4YCX7_9ACTN|nr:CocE/NonD family hydrolase [Streptomyces syringium]MBP2406515.1 putative acyl esterase [Streptomyces syringium]
MRTPSLHTAVPETARGAVPKRRRWAAALLGFLVLVLCMAAPGPAAAGPAVTLRPVVIPGTGGARLVGSVAEPAGPGPYPLIVMPLAWAAGEDHFRRTQLVAARSGYVFVLYGTRGTHQSGGVTDLGGPKDVADVARVVDWALAHTPADARHIGAAGVSYGAAMSLLGAAFDPRITSVAALSAWNDLYEVLQENGTPTVAGAVFTGWGAATGAADARGGPFRDVLNWDPERLAAWARPRSPAAYLERYNAAGTALFFGQSWDDSSSPAPGLGEFFDRLRVRKRLEMRPGDHGGAEFTANLLPNDVVNSALRWFDHTLKGVDNGVDREAPVQIKPENSGPLFGAGKSLEEHPSWSAMTGSVLRLFPTGGGSLGDRPPDAESHVPLVTGPGTVADSGVIGIQRTIEAALGAQLPRPLALIPPGTGAVWATGPLRTPGYVRGTPEVHLTVTPAASRGTVVAYLYDVNALGTGTLVTYAPYSFHDRRPGAPFTADFRLRPRAYDLPAGHRIALVVGTTDSRYLSRNPPLSRLSLSSTRASPSWVTLPLR